MHYSRKEIVMVLGIVALLLSSCGNETDKPMEKDPEISVAVETASLTGVNKSYGFTGTVEGEQRINLSTKVMGRITDLPVDRGERVSQGQVLLRIKNNNIKAQKSQVEANLVQARASLKNTETNYNRIKSLYEDSSATQKELDDIATQRDASQAQVEVLKAKLAEISDLMDYSVIESPINGYVVEKFVYQGDLASPGQSLLTVEGTSDLNVIVSVPAAQIDLFEPGDSVDVSVGAAGATFDGIVQSVNPSAANMSRQFEVKVAIPQHIIQQSSIKSGMFANVNLQKGNDELVMVPDSALVRRGQLTGLYTLNDENELILRWVNTGRQMDKKVEILSGMKPGERFVLTGQRKLKEGQKVAVQ